MTLLVSTQFKTLLLAGFPEIFNGGHIRVFSGTQPLTPDAAETSQGGVLIGAITMNGFPVGIGSPAALRYLASGAYITSFPLDIWVLTPTASQMASWFRVVTGPADTGDASLAYPRLDGAVGTVAGAAELILPTASLTLGTPVAPISFFYSIPPLVG